MLDHSQSKEERSKFILDYKIEGNNIIINLANGDKQIVPLTKENEQKILDNMKHQITSIDENKYYETIKKIKDENNSRILYCFIFASMLIIPTSILINHIIPIIILLACLGYMVKQNLENIYLSLIEKDYEKSKLFIENKELFDKKVKNMTNALQRTSKKTKESISNVEEDKPLITINTLDSIPQKDLKTIINNLSREEYFNFDYSKTSEIAETPEIPSLEIKPTHSKRRVRTRNN